MSTIDVGHCDARNEQAAEAVWADEEKREICAQAVTPGMSIAPEADASDQEAMFLPIEIDTSRVDITLSDGPRILIEGPTALPTMDRAIPALRMVSVRHRPQGETSG